MNPVELLHQSQDARDARTAQSVDALIAVPRVDYDASAQKGPQMLRRYGLFEPGGIGYPVHGGAAVCQMFQDRQPGRIGQGREQPRAEFTLFWSDLLHPGASKLHGILPYANIPVNPEASG